MLENLYSIITIMMLAVNTPTSSSEPASDAVPPEIKAVQAYMLEGDDYPELFGDEPYRVQISDILISDLDGDGKKEVILLIDPHYRQSPTIIIYRILKGMKVERVIEGLAPGPVVPLSGDYLDSHTLGEAVDLTLDKQQKDDKARKDFMEISMKELGAVVEYRDFFHADNRKGKGLYIDMTHLGSTPGKDTCGGFEFSKVETITVAEKNGAPGSYLLALAAGKLYAYDIRGFLPNGLLDKVVTVRDFDPKK